MKNIVAIVLCFVLTLSMVGCRPDGTTDTIELAEVSKWSQERVEKKLIGEHRENILYSWGEPCAVLSETSEKYYLNENDREYIILNYDNEGYIQEFIFGSDSK